MYNEFFINRFVIFRCKYIKSKEGRCWSNFVWCYSRIYVCFKCWWWYFESWIYFRGYSQLGKGNITPTPGHKISTSWRAYTGRVCNALWTVIKALLGEPESDQCNSWKWEKFFARKVCVYWLKSFGHWIPSQVLYSWPLSVFTCSKLTVEQCFKSVQSCYDHFYRAAIVDFQQVNAVGTRIAF